MKYILILFVLLTFSACEFQSPFGPNEAEIKLKNKELDAKLEIQRKELNTKKELELAKIDKELKKEEILIKKEKITSKNIELNSENEIKKLTLILSAIVIILISVGLFIYFTNRRKDKLKAYEDNLEKYYRQKEQDAKVKIANKIIDTISSGKLSSEQENKLLSTLAQDKIQSNTKSEIEPIIEEIEEKEDEEIIQLEYKKELPKKKKEKKKKKKEKKKDS